MWQNNSSATVNHSRLDREVFNQSISSISLRADLSSAAEDSARGFKKPVKSNQLAIGPIHEYTLSAKSLKVDLCSGPNF